jgi:RES domain-containing protein
MPRERTRRRTRPSFTTWSGLAYRVTSYDVPLWVSPNRRAGRWNRAGEGCTQYLALDAEAPWAEQLRYEDLRSEEDAGHYLGGLWQLRLDLGAVVDYSDFELAAAAGFPPEALVDDDYERCQSEAVWLASRGAIAVLSPSAALPGSTNLTVFGPRVQVSWSSTAALASAVPAQRLTTGHPPAGLTSRVRYFGHAHPGLERYRQHPRNHRQRPSPD